MTEQIHMPLRVLDANGDPVSGAKFVFTETGTATPLTVYSDEGLSTPHADPLVADAGGYAAQAFYSGFPAVRMRIYTSADVLLFDIDPAPTTRIGTAAEGVGFSPVTGNPATDVQSAIANNVTRIGRNEERITNSGTVRVTAGSGNTYTIAASDTITAYTIGQTFLVAPDRTNTGGSTLNVDGVGAVSLRKYDQTGAIVPLVAGDFALGRIYEVSYDGTQFLLAAPVKATTAVPGVVEFSNNSENLAGAATDKAITPAGVTTMLGVKLVAGGRFNGTGTPAWDFNFGFNTSITDNGTGDYSVTFGTVQDDANYLVFGSIISPGAGDLQRVFVYPYSLSTSGFSIRTNETSSGQADYDDIQLMVFRLGWV